MTRTWNTLAALAVGLLATVAATAADRTIWQDNWADAKLGQNADQPGVVEDALAPSGKALRLVYHGRPDDRIYNKQNFPLAGPGELVLTVRGTNLRQLDHDLQLQAQLRNTVTNDTYRFGMAVNGARITADGYREIRLPFQAGSTPVLYAVNVQGVWADHAAETQPEIFIGSVALIAAGDDTPFISRTWHNKVIYPPGEDVLAKVFVVNPTAAPFSGQLVVDDFFGLTGHRQATTVPVNCPAGETRRLDVSWVAEGPKAGHRYVVRLLAADGTELDLDARDYGVETDGRKLNFQVRDLDMGRLRPDASGGLYVSPSSPIESRNTVDNLRDVQRLGRFEFFSWSWCDLAGFISPEDPYIGNQGAWWLSVREYKSQVAMVRDSGIRVVSYIAGWALGEAGYALFRNHPDWFTYTRDGEVAWYNMDTHALFGRRHEFGFKQHRKRSFCGVLDATNPEVRRWIADQIITLGRDMGFQGARFDVWAMYTSPNFYLIDGSQQVADIAEEDRTTAAAIRDVKRMVNAELPDFSWGYNWPGELALAGERPETFIEMCRDGGWILDEKNISYSRKSSPYHTWDVYSKRMVEWGDKVRQAGGTYNPWQFGRGSSPMSTDTDWLFTTIFHILAGGRTQAGGFYKNDSALVGDLSTLPFRYNNLYSGAALRLQPEDQTRIAVTAPDTVWWRGYVFTNTALDGRDQDLVHLVNAPVILDEEANPESLIRPPVGPLTVRCTGRDGALPSRAWLVAAEPLTPNAEPAVLARPLALTTTGDGVTVTVPSLLYFKTVVFEY